MVKLSVLLTTLCLQLVYGRRVPAVYGQETVQDRLQEGNSDDNEVSVLPEGNLRLHTIPRTTNYVAISDMPKTEYNRNVGEHVEFSCQAKGAPMPVIQWYKGNKKLTSNEKSSEDNFIMQTDVGFGRVASRLVINYVLPRHQGVYYCEATANTEVERKEVYLNVPNGEGREMNFTELVALRILGAFHKPRITYWNEYILAHINSDIVLPCTSVGNPLPDFAWKLPDSQVITKDEPRDRFSVNSIGELTLRNLVWTDMGDYTCYVRNREGEDSVKTFVYPLANK